MTRIRRMFTFSNVIAMIALFIALGGSVYAAAKINGKQIKPQSIPGNRIKPGTVTGKQIKNQSLTGQQVVGSSLSGVSASNLASVQYVTSSGTVNSTEKQTTVTAVCPAGTKVIGGGAQIAKEEEAYVNDSGPSADRSGWTANGYAYSTGSTTMTVTAICTAVASATG